MLVLSRKVGEELVFGDDIILTVKKISGGRVHMGVEAPEKVPILRGELVGSGKKETKWKGKNVSLDDELDGLNLNQEYRTAVEFIDSRNKESGYVPDSGLLDNLCDGLSRIGEQKKYIDDLKIKYGVR